MPLYTVRCVLTLAPETARGSNTAIMSHHFTFLTEGAAYDSLPDLVDKFTNSAVADRWTCARAEATHELQLYRRSIENPRSFHHVRTVTFTLADWITAEQDVEINDVPLTITARETPIYKHRRGGVLVVQRNAARTVEKRTYVGPLSPVYFRANVTLAIPFFPDLPAMFGLPGPGADFPPQEEDSVDRWRLNIAQIAATHVMGIDADFAGGSSALVSWEHGIIDDVDETRASLVRADMRSRGIRHEMTGAAEDGY